MMHGVRLGGWPDRNIRLHSAEGRSEASVSAFESLPHGSWSINSPTRRRARRELSKQGHRSRRAAINARAADSTVSRRGTISVRAADPTH